MAWLVEVSCNGGVSVVGDGVTVGVHSLAECLLSLPYILFVAFEASDKIDYLARVTRYVVADGECFVRGV